MLKSDARPTPPQLLQIALILLLFGAGLAIRLYDLTDLPMDFHPARQYHSAVIARGLYERWGGEYPAWEIPLIRSQAASEARIEPPIYEYLTAGTYLLFRSDALWIPRLYAIAFWLAGAIPLFLLTGKYLGFTGGFISLGFFLLLPYGVYASRSFQPDPLMVSLGIYTLWALDRWQEKPNWKWAVLTGLLMGMAVLVKQVAVFFLPAAFLAIALWKKKFWAVLKNVQFWVIGILAVLPAGLYNLYGIFISGTLAGQYAERFFPQLWIDPGFYIRWSSMIRHTAGLVVFFLSLAGILLMRKSPLKTMLIGYLIGYVIYGFVFAHHISTHDYYQLPLIPLIAAGIGSAVNSLLTEIRTANPGRLGSAAIIVLMTGAALFCLWDARSTLKRMDYRPEAKLLADLSAEMGGNAATTIGLMEDYGAALSYYGFILPEYWASEENGAAISTLDESQVEELVKRRTAGRQYFILSDFNAMDSQPQVQDYLDTHYQIFYENERYRIYDLMKPLGQSGKYEKQSSRRAADQTGAAHSCG